MQLIEKQLRKMGLRLEGTFTLKSGTQSSVKWDIEKMFQYPEWTRIETLQPWIWEISLYKPGRIIGIRTGGLGLAHDIGKCLNVYVLNNDGYVECGGESGRKCNNQAVVVDDVITTGETIRGYLGGNVVAIAVLINRLGLDELDGIPIITGVFADRV